ncbi:MAG: hypothetical protein AAF602_29030, partial [Myxococcota bacterium]
PPSSACPRPVARPIPTGAHGWRGCRWLVLGEVPTERESWGLAVVVVGCLANGILAIRERPSGSAARPVLGMLMMAAVSGLWSASGVVDKVALQHAAPATHATFVALGTMAALLGLLAARGTLRDLVPAPADRLPLVGAIGTLGLAYALQLLAVSAIAVGLVEGVKRGFGVPAALLSGWALFGESVSWARQGVAIVVVAGLVLLQGPG